MTFTAAQIATVVGGTIVGDAEATVHTVAPLDRGVAGGLSFLSNAKLTEHIYSTPSSVVLIDKSITLSRPVSTTLIVVPNAYVAMSQLLQYYETLRAPAEGIDARASVSPSAEVDEHCYVGPFAYVGAGAKIAAGCRIYPYAYVGDNVSVGAGTTLYPHVTIYHDCVIGCRVILHAGCVIGADGFGFTPTDDGYQKIPQVGNVVIDDDVEIGANSCVDRGTLGATHIGKGVKLDNLVQIAHNIDVGAHTVMSAQVGIAGSTQVGEWCTFAGQVGIAGHLTIGDHVMLGAKTGVPSSIPSHQALIGVPPMPQRSFFQNLALLRRLPSLFREFRALQQEVAALRAQNNDNNESNDK